MVRHHRRELLMMVSDTRYSSRSGSQIPKPRFIGNRWMPTFLERPSSVDQACRHFKPRETLSLRPWATNITPSSMDTYCSVLKSNRNVLTAGLFHSDARQIN